MKITLPISDCRLPIGIKSSGARPLSPHAARLTSHARSGIALVITLIMLSIITFMTVTFLIISQRERGSVTVTTDSTIAKFAVDAAYNRAVAQILAPMLATTNGQLLGMIVSTNYDKDVSLINLLNVQYDPRTMVFMSNPITGRMENRFYVDLNRNGVFDPNGMVPETNSFGQPTGRTNFYFGDPEWIGVLTHPDQPYSSTNFYTSRIAFFVQPEGMLDVNYAHNQSMNASSVRGALPVGGSDGFGRNEGVGTWEINLPAFFADLNTNQWNAATSPYYYGQPAFPNTGIAFFDALSFLRYRYANNYGTLRSAKVSLPLNKFTTDGIDQYAEGPIFITKLNEGTPGDPVNQPWAGSDNTNHFFTTQEFFDPNKTAIGVPANNSFITRLSNASSAANLDSYNRNTFYRMISQLGTASSPETGKLNLNYVNVDAGGNVVSSLVTNFVPWTPLQFFTNAANMMLSNYFANVAYPTNLANSLANVAYTNNGMAYLYPQNLSVANIQIYPANFYTPAVHRILQLAANMYDATTNSFYPTVFRPLFRTDGKSVFITGYEQVPSVTDINDFRLATPVDAATYVNGPSRFVANIYGAPWVIGAKKGLPNFNQLALESALQVTRKIQVTRPSINGDKTPNFANFRTNQMYLFNMTNYLGVNCWNSYQTAYANPVTIVVRNYMTTSLSTTNTPAFSLRFSPIVTGATNVVTTWSGTLNPQNPSAQSFKIPLNSSLMVITNSVYYFGSLRVPGSPFVAGFIPVAYTGDFLEKNNLLPLPHMILQTTNQTQVFMLDGNHVIDYVALDGPVSTRDLNAEIGNSDQYSLWDDRPIGAGVPYQSGLPVGPYNQVAYSQGYGPRPPGSDGGGRWDAPAGFPIGVVQNTASEQAFCRAFFSPNNIASGLVNTQLVMQLPYTPTRIAVQYLTLQANDPLVHYTVSDLTDLANTNITRQINSLLEGNQPYVGPLNGLNHRYMPWGGYPKVEQGAPQPDQNPFSTAIKDPGMSSSDNWDFPTNLFPNIGWLGRVHRGTPWQTVYMKPRELVPPINNWVNESAALVNIKGNLASVLAPDWTRTTGDKNFADAALTRPANDRQLFDLFTTAINDNSTRGQLSVNVGSTNNLDNLAAWSAVLSGVVVLTNVDVNSGGLSPIVIQPAGVYASTNPPPLVRIVQGINSARMNNRGAFQHEGDVLAAPELTEKSPFLNTNSLPTLNAGGISDAVMERIPQQVMSLLTLSRTPRFVIYSYGQTLRPADRSIVNNAGLVKGVSLFGVCTNYQVTAETATRTVIRVDNAPVPGSTNMTPHIVVESYNILGPD